MKKKIVFLKQPIVYLFIFLLLVNGFIDALFIRRSIVTLREQINVRMLDIANSAASLLDGDIMAKLQKEDVDTPEYQSSLAILSHFRDQIALDFIYGIRDMGNNTFTFTIDPEPVTPGEFGTPVATTEALIAASKGIPSVDQEPYQDAWGSFYSAYSPIFDSKGKVAGIIGVDFNAKWYEEQIARQIRMIVFACVLSIIGGGGIVFLFTRRTRKQFQILNKEMGKMTDEIEELAEELSLTTGFQAVDAERYMNPGKFKAADTSTLLQEIYDRLRSVRKELREYIEKAHIMAYTDILTGMGNRNAYFEVKEKLNKKISKGNVTFAVAIFDINGLKNANDDYGHETGDLMIVSVAEILKQFFKKGTLFRIGGDEFVAIVENTSNEQMSIILDKISAEIDSKIIVKNELHIPLAISKGFSVYTPEDKEVKIVVQRADAQMYQNKTEYYTKHADRRRKR